ncbi:9476_t:CDS:2 [Acaulospora colombiana]|uniref:9476_t:CDS:1 n=1 Tax=Acaulospora colombiana TaxID=27376 RepID=A0ACA9LJZ2_9GLOM|nr:9476_t:CDS:2 [Acaulospora colombiana]
MASLRNVMKVHQNSTALFICDVQEKFRPHIHQFLSVVSTAQKMIAASKILEIPMVVTEQNPKALGKTIHELDINNAKVVSKMKFSMLVPEVVEALKEKNTKSILLLGIETTLDLLENNYDVHVLADAYASSRRISDNI